MFAIELLPAAHGDAIWIEYGAASKPHRILIDGGPAPTYENGLRRRILDLPAPKREFDLMVVTHIDADHIDGSLILLQELDALKLHIDELWFNGWTQLPDTTKAPGTYAPLQGEFLGGLIEVKKLRDVWNKSFDHRAVAVPDAGLLPSPLPSIDLPGGAALTLLGPTMADLLRLRNRWTAAIRDFSPGDTKEALSRLEARREYRPPALPAAFGPPEVGDDRSPANGSTIACVLEYKGVSVLLAGDAHARSLADSLKRLADQRSVARLRFDAVKLPHHGSMGNISENWLEWVDCQCWLISTNGAVFKHPDLKTAELLAKRYTLPALLCNYSDIAVQLDKQALGRWTTTSPALGTAGGLRLSLPAGAG